VRLLLAHFARFAPTDGTDFSRDLAPLARTAERAGRRLLAGAAREILSDWNIRRCPTSRARNTGRLSRAAPAGLARGRGAPGLPHGVQPTRKIPRLGFLSPTAPLAAPSQPAFLQALRELGYAEGETILFESRRARGDDLDRRLGRHS